VGRWDETEEIRRLIEAGVASVTTNAPDIALRVRNGAEPAEKGLAVFDRPQWDRLLA